VPAIHCTPHPLHLPLPSIHLWRLGATGYLLAMASDSALAVFAQALSMDRVSCQQLLADGPNIARQLGYTRGGIQRGSYAALGMSLEAKRHWGKPTKMSRGGVSASLQSIGAKGVIKPEAYKSISYALGQESLKLDTDAYLLAPLKLPQYFSSATPEIPMLIDDYRPGGHNYKMAEKMLNESFHTDTTTGQRCVCSVHLSHTLKVRKLQRIENKAVFEYFRSHETKVAHRLSSGCVTPPPGYERVRDSLDQRHGWLKALADKNGLSRLSNTVYLLHGTPAANVAQICEEGLAAGRANDGVYGTGLYFTDCSCKAYQYARKANPAAGGCILVCRVVLGFIELLDTPVLAPPGGPSPWPAANVDSWHAMKGHTTRPPLQVQVHNEFVVFNDCAVYPEFVITCEAEA